MRLRSSVAAAFLAAALPFVAFADESSSSSTASDASSSEAVSSQSSLSGFGVITIEQEPAQGFSGSWKILGNTGNEYTGSTLSEVLTNVPAGLYTVFVTPPSGASTSVRVYENGASVKFVTVPQASLRVDNGSAIRVSIHYQFTKLGIVSVTSDPLGIPYTVSGPNGFTDKDVTPKSYEAQPEGQYKVQFLPPSGCGAPPAKGNMLEAGSRASFSVTLNCKAADALRARQSTNGVGGTGDFVTVTVNGNSVTLRDVGQGTWFATAVASVTKTGVMAGYRDADGNPLGIFGPENPVTAAELAKIAHAVAGLDDVSGGQQPINARAQEGWFSSVIASAEQRGWTIYADGGINPLRPATRGEVLVTLLQAVDKPLSWGKGNVFTDVSARTPYASAIETAAALKWVTGKTDDAGLKIFSPNDPINRAELAKILTVVSAGTKGED